MRGCLKEVRTRTIALLLIAVLVLVVAIGALRSRTPRRAYIVATSSLKARFVPHRTGEVRVGGLVLLASALAELRRQHGPERVAYLDAGNALFGDSSIVNVGANVAEVLAQLDCRATTLGYRDFEVIRQMNSPRLPVLACNLEDTLGGIQCQPFLRMNLGGIDFGVIGVVDPAAANEQIDDVAGVVIGDQPHCVERIGELASRLRSDGAELVLLLSSALTTDVNDDFAQHCSGIDAIVAFGEADRGICRKIAGKLIVGSAWEAKTVALLEAVETADGSLRLSCRELNVTSRNYRPDPAICEIVERHWIDNVRHGGDDRVIGTADEVAGVPFAVANDLSLAYPYWRFFNRPMYNFVPDALREEYPHWRSQLVGGATAPPADGITAPPAGTIDIVLYNSGAIEDGLPPGVVTRDALTAAVPYDNKLYEARLSRDDIVQVLNSPAMRTRGLLAVSGLRYRWDYVDGVRAEEIELVRRDGGAAPFEPGEYRVLMTDFLALGGDGYMAAPRFAELRERARAARLKESNEYPGTLELLERHIRRCSPVRAADDRRVKFLR